MEARYNIGYRLQNSVILTPYQPHEAAFTYVAAAIDIAQVMLVHDTTKHVLTQLALHFDNISYQSRNFQNSSHVARQWIDWFVQNLIEAFSPVLVDFTLTHPDCVAYHQRMPWDGDLSQFPFGRRAGVHLNGDRVNDMITAGATNTPQGRRRFKTFLFVFATSIVHEIGPHVLITWLSNGRQDTPINIGVEEYNSPRETPPRGESGRWFEVAVFGGTTEFYRDLTQDDGQPGIPHQIDQNGQAWRIRPSFIDEICDRRITFPFQRTGRSIDPLDMQSMGMHSTAPIPNAPTITARQLDWSRLRPYTVSKARVWQVPSNPQLMLHAI